MEEKKRPAETGETASAQAKSGSQGAAPAGSARAEVPAPQRSKYPTVGDVLAMIGIYLVGSLIGLFVAIIFGFGAKAGVDLSPEAKGKLLGVSMLVANAVVLAGLIIYRGARGGSGPVARFSPRGLNPVLILWGFLLILAVGVVLEPLLSLLPPPKLEELGSGVWLMAAVVLIAPVFEELICRGVVLESLRARYGAVVAWFVSALYFGIIHFQPQQSVNAFFIGLILAFLYLRTNSIWIVILLHMLNNAVAYIALLMEMDSATMLSDLLGGGTVYALVYIAAAVLCAVSGVMVWRTLRRLDAEDKNRAAA